MTETLDVKGMSCPLPVLRANRALRQMPPGATLRVLATDRGGGADLAACSQETGHLWRPQHAAGGVCACPSQRRAAPPDDPADPRDAS